MFGLPGAEKKQIVGLAVTPNLGLEALVYDKNGNEVVKYGQKFLEYNIASREIQDMNTFRSAVSDIFNELEINRDNANIYLVLPNVHFGFRSIEDSSVDSDAIESMILSEASESYIFKQEEPQSAWVDLNAKTGASSKYIAHSSIQRKVVDAIQDAVMDINANIVGIESATSAIPRGVALTGLCNDVIANNQAWDILLINPNNYAIFQMSGSRILDYLEVPFAIMSFEGDEVYSALSSAIAQYLPNYPAKKLVIASQTDNVSAKLLKSEIVFDEEIVTVDSNKFSTGPCAAVASNVIKQTAASMSLCALGAASPKCGNFATLNVLGEMSYDGVISYGTIELKDKEIELTSEVITKASIVLSGVFLVFSLLVCGTFLGIASYYGSQLNSVQEKVNALNSEIEQINAKLKAGIGALIKQISENNKQAINYYDSLSSDIPPHVWLTYYINKDGKEVGIEGFSMEIADIYEYFKSLKILAPKSDIKLNKLEVFKEEALDKGDIDGIVLTEDKAQQTFSFEISNTTYEKTFDEKGNKAQSGEADPNAKQSYAARIPNVPDVEINLKEVK
ncbi:MAG: hypothetical protein Q4F80_05245 [bacterium]|nr:hypothetical protein [bacterium]